MHPLKKYLQEKEIAQASWARRLDASPQLLSDVFKGRTFLGREKALKCVELTGGRVTLEELMTWSAPKSAA